MSAVEHNAPSVYRGYLVSRLNGERRAEFWRAWGPRFERGAYIQCVWGETPLLSPQTPWRLYDRLVRLVPSTAFFVGARENTDRRQNISAIETMITKYSNPCHHAQTPNIETKFHFDRKSSVWMPNPESICQINDINIDPIISTHLPLPGNLERLPH